MSEFSLDAYN